MIASFLHSLIFIKTKKTAGTSAEIVMSSWVGPADIVAAIGPQDEMLRAQFGGRPQNYSGSAEHESEVLRRIASGDVRALKAVYREQRKNHRFYAHMPALEVQAALPELWERAYKFAVERHPYEKTVSRAWMGVPEHHPHPEQRFAEQLEQVIAGNRVLNHPLYMGEGRLLVDRVIPFEQFWPELAALAARLGQALPATLPQAKGGNRKDRRPAAEQLTAEQKRRIAAKHAVEFELMGYQR